MDTLLAVLITRMLEVFDDRTDQSVVHDLGNHREVRKVGDQPEVVMAVVRVLYVGRLVVVGSAQG